MLPDWLKKTDDYKPPSGGGAFTLTSIKTMGKIMSGIKLQAGHEKVRALPASVKLFALVLFIFTVSLFQNRTVLAAAYAVTLLYLCTWPARDIWNILKSALAAAGFALLLFLPAMIINPAGIRNNITVVLKIFICVTALNIFNHTTQWNHITSALRKIHIPGVFIFTLDITLKFIVLLGGFIHDVLTCVQIRSVGRHNKEYSSVGGVLGVTFIKGAKMNGQMYEAMRCRGFTDDYKGL